MFNTQDSMNNNLKSPIIIFGVILSIGLVLMSVIASQTMLKIKRDANVVTVTGSAKKDVVSDSGKLFVSFSRPAKVSTLGASYTEMKKDSEKIVSYLKSKGITDAEIVVNSVNAEDVWDQAERTRKDYTLRQSIEVMSSNVNLIDAISKDITSLAQTGIVLNVNASYTYTKLAEERVSLLSSAIDDAKLRADAIASKSSRKIGEIQSASSGVVQVLSPGSIEVQDYGSYDTSTINKTVMITTKVSFSLK
jgi:hypothetical protein